MSPLRTQSHAGSNATTLKLLWWHQAAGDCLEHGKRAPDRHCNSGRLAAQISSPITAFRWNVSSFLDLFGQTKHWTVTNSFVNLYNFWSTTFWCIRPFGESSYKSILKALKTKYFHCKVVSFLSREKRKIGGKNDLAVKGGVRGFGHQCSILLCICCWRNPKRSLPQLFMQNKESISPHCTGGFDIEHSGYEELRLESR